MIQKRYQYWSSTGIRWTPWFDYCPDNGQLPHLQIEEKWQLKNRLLNEYKVI